MTLTVDSPANEFEKQPFKSNKNIHVAMYNELGFK
jgi:hypothetical protein